MSRVLELETALRRVREFVSDEFDRREVAGACPNDSDYWQEPDRVLRLIDAALDVDPTPSAEFRMRQFLLDLADNDSDPTEPVADNGMTVWDAVRGEARVLVMPTMERGHEIRHSKDGE